MVADVEADNQWVILRVKVIQLWDNTSDKITQTCPIGDETKLSEYIRLSKI